ncbi:hypothetical protein [Terriglobus sp. RCC_193]|uniref:hypothetical protein n=1 Tax=Terriglobus sp. RCC_193 TaxID=3239218 RepID=UPI0035253440
MSKRYMREYSAIHGAARWLPLLIVGMFAAGMHGQTSGVPPLVSGDCNVASNSVMTCSRTNGVAFAASATTDTTNAANIASGTLPAAQTAAISGDVTKAAGSAVATVTRVNGASIPTVSGIAATNTSGQLVAATAIQARALVCTGSQSQYYYCDPSTGAWGAIASVPAVSSAVAISGGTINGTPIGATTPNSGAFTTLSSSGQTTSTGASAASTPARLDTGTLYTAGTGTTGTPHWYINQGAAVSSWTSGGIEFGINAPSGFGGVFFSTHVNGGNPLFEVWGDGSLRWGASGATWLNAVSGVLVSNKSLSLPSYTATATTGGFVAPLYTPASSTATCTVGTVAWDASYLYVCRAANTWSRAALSTF